MDGTTLTRELDALAIEAPAVPATCGTCGELDAPDGGCLNAGACQTADEHATRGATGARAKYAPAAWTSRGSVD